MLPFQTIMWPLLALLVVPTTAPPPDSGAKGDDCYEMDVDYPDNNLNDGSKTIAKTALDCQKLCLANEACVAFTWISDEIPDGSFFSGREGECWLKHTKNNQKPSWPTDYLISGPRECVNSGSTPTVIQYILEVLLDRPDWKNYLPHDFDVDINGNLSLTEVEHKIKGDMNEVFRKLDQDEDNTVTEDEFRSIRIDYEGVDRIMSLAFESYPIKGFIDYFDYLDTNKNGFFDEDDFVHGLGSENITYRLLMDYLDTNRKSVLEDKDFIMSIGGENIGDDCYEMDVDYPDNNLNDGSKTIKKTALDCQKLCLNNEACVAFTWISDEIPDGSFFSGREGECWLKHTKNNQKPSWPTDYLISGPRECVNSGADRRKQFRNQMLLKVFGPYIFIADTNLDKKVTIGELKTKGRGFVSDLLPLLDQTQDGFLSVKDATTFNLRIGALTTVIMDLFELITKQTGQNASVDILNNPIISYSVKYLGFGTLDFNSDGAFNLKDFYLMSEQFRFGQKAWLVSVALRNLDPNQDGKIEYNEFLNFVRIIRENMDNGNTFDGFISLNDVYSLMLEAGFSCLQVEEIRTFVERYTEIIETGMDKLLVYFFTEFDLDGNREIPLEEFYNMRVPCEVGRRSRYFGYDNDGHDGSINYDDSHDKVRDYGRVTDISKSEEPKTHRCDELDLDFFFGRKFPAMPSMFEHRRHSHQKIWEVRGKSLDKLANSACMIMQPHA